MNLDAEKLASELADALRPVFAEVKRICMQLVKAFCQLWDPPIRANRYQIKRTIERRKRLVRKLSKRCPF